MRHFIAFVPALTVISCAGTQERAFVHVPASPATIAIERVATHAFLAEYDRTVAAIQTQLDEAAFAAAWAEGRALTLEQAIAYALGAGD